MLTVLLGLSAALSYALHDLLVVPATRRARPLTVMFWVLCSSLAILLTLALFLDGLPHGAAQWRAIGWAAVGGVFYVAALFALLRGFSVGALSLVTPLAALEGAFATVYSVLNGEAIAGVAVIALPLAVVGGVLASIAMGKPGGEDTGSPAGLARRRARLAPAAGAGWGLLCGALFAVTLLTYAEAGAVGPVTAAAAGRLASTPLVAPLVLAARVSRLDRSLRPRTLLAGACEAGGYIAAAAALARGPVSTASVMIAQFALFAVVLGIVVLRERPAPHQLLGIALTVLAVTLLGLAA